MLYHAALCTALGRTAHRSHTHPASPSSALGPQSGPAPSAPAAPRSHPATSKTIYALRPFTAPCSPAPRPRHLRHGLGDSVRWLAPRNGQPHGDVRLGVAWLDAGGLAMAGDLCGVTR